MDEFCEGLGLNQGSNLGIEVESRKFIVQYKRMDFKHEDAKFQEDKQLLLSNNYNISQIHGMVRNELVSFNNISTYKVRWGPIITL